MDERDKIVLQALADEREQAREQGWAAEEGDADRFRQGFGLFRAGKSRPTVRG